MNAVRVFAAMFAGYLVVQMVASWSWQLRYYRVSRSLEAPGRLLALWPIASLSERGFLMSGGALVAGCLLGLAGVRAGFGLAAVASLAYFSQIRLLNTVQRKVNLLPQVLVLLALTPAAAGDWFVPADPSVLVVIEVLLALVYVNSGMTKLRVSGFRWMDGQALQAYLFEADLRYDIPAARALAANRPLCAGLSTAVMAFECLGWVLLLVPYGAFVFAVSGLAFHAATYAFMRVNFLKYHGPVFLVFAASPIAGVIGPVLGAP